jgi:hypothetical protein
MSFINIKIAFLLFIILFALPFNGLAEVKVDGHIDELEWAGAQSFRDFVVIDPLTLETPRLATEVKVLSVPEGLAIAFICEQPSGETRTRTTTPLDAARFDSDSVSLMIDFDGTGKVAYEFSESLSGSYRDGSITDETRFSYDWDGVWQRAVNEEPERWTAEFLVPWSIAAMRDGDGDTRSIGVSFQRVLLSRNEKYAFPAASPDMGRYVSNFAKIEVPRYSTQELDVWPYVTVLSDLVNNTIKAKAGLDLFWKRNGSLQVAATLNPDFGQVESDDLIINFSAIETFYTEKRPFFTENQSIFKLGIPRSGNLIYTRRIGGPSDKDGSPTDIAGALKAIGSIGHIDYGVFAARESGDEGRRYYTGRLSFPAQNYSLGLLATYVDRPFLNRAALVNVIDYDIKLGNAIRWEGKFLSSNIDSPIENGTDYGAYSSFLYSPSETWNCQTVLTRYGRNFNISDMGYVARNNLEELYLSGLWRRTDFPDDSSIAGISWRLTSIFGRNTYGDRLPFSYTLNRTEKLKSGSDISVQFGLDASGYDDMISRGHGLVLLNDRWNGSITYTTPRRNAWRESLTFKVFQEGYDDWGFGIDTNATWYPHKNITVDFSINPRWSNDWLIWLRDDRLASFSSRQVRANILTTWFPAENHEVRLRAQLVAINADAEQGYRIGSKGRLVQINDIINNFATTNFGLQFRYRYEIAPLSDLYIVYSRGGIERIDDPDNSTLGLLGSSMSLRDSDQILVKLRYRF